MKDMQVPEKNDLLYISNLASLGDGYQEVQEQWRFLTKTKKVDIVLTDMPQIDTRKGKSGYGPLIADTVLMMLEFVNADEQFSFVNLDMDLYIPMFEGFKLQVIAKLAMFVRNFKLKQGRICAKHKFQDKRWITRLLGTL